MSNALVRTLPGFEMTEADAYAMAVAQPLELKIRLAIAFLQTNEPIAMSMSPDGYYLAFSGGKDSIVIHELARMAGVKFAPFYNQTTIDPPELVRFIQREYGHVAWNRPKKHLIWQMTDESQGPPTRKARWCCEIYKEHGGDGMCKVLGVRGPESPRRAATWKQTTKTRRSGVILCPILYWTDADVWAFIRLRGLAYCSLYDEGFTRLGCIGCPMSGPDGARRDFARWPGFERLWQAGFRRYWARWKGVPRRDGKPRWIEHMGSWEELWRWWVSREGWAKAEGCQMTLGMGGGDDEPQGGPLGRALGEE